MPMSDKEAFEYYSAPEHRLPTGSARRRSKPGMSSHVPIRFLSDPGTHRLAVTSSKDLHLGDSLREKPNRYVGTHPWLRPTARRPGGQPVLGVAVILERFLVTHWHHLSPFFEVALLQPSACFIDSYRPRLPHIA